MLFRPFFVFFFGAISKVVAGKETSPILKRTHVEMLPKANMPAFSNVTVATEA